MTSQTPDFRLERDLYELAVALIRALKLQLRSQEDGASEELTFSLLRLLLAVQLGQDQVGKLARYAGMAQPAVSKAVEQLIGQGYLLRRPLAADRRCQQLLLTAKGQAAIETLFFQAAHVCLPELAQLPAAERAALADSLTLLKSLMHERKDRL